tara:strand:- start:78 stop:671 length:594 start_codon:yes stop_codon:yes gene_type:complete
VIKGIIMEDFILYFQVPDKICDDLIEYYKKNKDDKHNTDRLWPKEVKEGTDVYCYPASNNLAIRNYLNCMFEGLEAYRKKYKHFNQMTLISTAFIIQHYPPKGGYKEWHNERMQAQSVQRSLVFMTYLNDLPDGGGTEFAYYPELRLKAKKGISLIWPTDFTHTHRSIISNYEKYIATGWFNHPDVMEIAKLPNELL